MASSVLVLRGPELKGTFTFVDIDGTTRSLALSEISDLKTMDGQMVQVDEGTKSELRCNDILINQSNWMRIVKDGSNVIRSITLESSFEHPPGEYSKDLVAPKPYEDENTAALVDILNRGGIPHSSWNNLEKRNDIFASVLGDVYRIISFGRVDTTRPAENRNEEVRAIPMVAMQMVAEYYDTARIGLPSIDEDPPATISASETTFTFMWDPQAREWLMHSQSPEEFRRGPQRLHLKSLEILEDKGAPFAEGTYRVSVNKTIPAIMVVSQQLPVNLRSIHLFTAIGCVKHKVSCIEIDSSLSDTDSKFGEWYAGLKCEPKIIVIDEDQTDEVDKYFEISQKFKLEINDIVLDLEDMSVTDASLSLSPPQSPNSEFDEEENRMEDAMRTYHEKSYFAGIDDRYHQLRVYKSRYPTDHFVVVVRNPGIHHWSAIEALNGVGYDILLCGVSFHLVTSKVLPNAQVYRYSKSTTLPKL